MNVQSLGTVIAVRRLECHTVDGGVSEVLIKIGRPKKYRQHVSYCPYQIIGIGNEGLSYAMGGDHLQALLLAMTKIGAEIYSSQEAKENRLTWMEDQSHNLGIPVFAEVYEHVVPSQTMKLIV